MLNAVIHNFQEQLEYSAQLSDEPAWVAFYKRLWPDMIAAVRIDKNSQFQKWGIDREILLPNGKRFSIDEKKRTKYWGDILLEEWSVADFDYETKIVKGKKIGWALDPEKRCDFVAYSIPDAGKCFLLPFELTRQAFKANLAAWKAKGPAWYPKAARNEGYITINVAVPYDVFKAALWQQMHRAFGSAIPLPLMSRETSQLGLFQHGNLGEKP